MYIAFEGIDGSGKTTICKYISSYLRRNGYKVLTVGFPSNNEIGKLAKKMLKGEIKWNEIAFELLITADMLQCNHKIKKFLKNGGIVLSDRSPYSSIAYRPHLRNWIEKIHKPLIKPDIVIFLDVSVDNALKRIYKHDKYEKKKYLEIARRTYLRLSKELNFVKINANKNFKKVFLDVKHIIESSVKNKRLSLRPSQ